MVLSEFIGTRKHRRLQVGWTIAQRNLRFDHRRIPAHVQLVVHKDGGAGTGQQSRIIGFHV